MEHRPKTVRQISLRGMWKRFIPIKEDIATETCPDVRSILSLSVSQIYDLKNKLGSSR